jgi:hypothetical protein
MRAQASAGARDFQKISSSCIFCSVGVDNFFLRSKQPNTARVETVIRGETKKTLHRIGSGMLLPCYWQANSWRLSQERTGVLYMP